MADGTNNGNDVIIPLSVDVGGVDASLESLEAKVDALRSKLLEMTADSKEYLDVQTELVATTNRLTSANETFAGALGSVSEAGNNVAESANVITTGFESAAKGSSDLSDALNFVSTELTQSGESAKEAAQGTEWYKRTIDELENGAGILGVTMGELKASQKELTKEMEKEVAGSDRWKELNADLQTVKNAQREYKELARETEGEMQTNTNTIAGMRAEVRELTKEWANADMGSAEFEELSIRLADTTEKLKAQEAAVGKNQRDVGNYRGQIEGLTKDMGALGGVFPGVAKGAGAATGAIGKVNLAFKALLANPIVLVIAAIVGIIMSLVKALKSSEEATQRLNAIFAPLKRTFDAIMNILQKVVGVILSAVEAVMKFIGSLAKLAERLPIVGKYIKQANDAMAESIQLEKDKYALDQRVREQQVANAKNERDIAELRAKAAEKEKYTAEERLAMIREAGRLEKENADAALEIAKERLRIAEAEAARSQNNKQTEEELAKLRADVFNAEKSYSDKMRQLNSQEATFQKEIETERKAAADAEKKRQEDAAKAVANVQKRISDITLDEFTKRRTAAEKQYQTDLATLKANGQDTAELTKAHEAELTKIVADERAKRSTDANKAVTDEIKAVDARYKAVDDAEKIAAGRRAVERTELNAALMAATAANDTAVIEAVQTRLAEIKRIEEEAEQTRLETEAARLAARLEALQQSIADDQIIGDERIAIQQQIADAMNAIDLNTVAQAQAAADKRVATHKAEAAAQVKISQERTKSEKKIQDTINGFAEAGLNLLGEHTVAAKILGTAQATVNTWVGASQALTLPFPANIAAMAATITAGLATVMNIWKVKVPGESGTPTPNISMPSVSASPSYETPITETHQNITGDEMDEINASQRVYLVESDVTETQRRVRMTESESTF